MEQKRAATLARLLLDRARRREAVQGILDELAAVPLSALVTDLRDTAERRAFWIEIYNATALIAMADGVDLRRPCARLRHFARRRLVVAGVPLSLNEIEHGMLRSSKLWWAMGHLNDPFPSKFERLLRVPLDPRIHFALNCGAASCPPIAHYNGPRLDEQLEIAAASFLEGTRYDPGKNIVLVSRLLLWYGRDLGGRPGILRLLQHHGLLPAEADPRIAFQHYDWGRA